MDLHHKYPPVDERRILNLLFNGQLPLLMDLFGKVMEHLKKVVFLLSHEDHSLGVSSSY